MAGEKYFLFQREPVTEFSSTESDTGDGLSVIAVPATKLGNVTARAGRVVFTFTDAGIYQTYGGSINEGLPNVRIEVACESGNEVALIEQVLTFTSKDTGRSIMKFDAVNRVSSFGLAKVDSDADVQSKVPVRPIILSTGAVSDDPAATDVTQTTTTTIADITFPAPSLMPIIDYNETGLAGLSINDQVGAANTWANAGTGGATYNITGDDGTPDVQRNNGIMGSNDIAVQFATSENLHLANTLEVEGAYTAYAVVGTTGPYSVFAGSLFAHNSLGTNLGFSGAVGEAPDEFYVNHAIGSSYPQAFVNTNNTADGTVSYRIPDPLLDRPDVNTSLFDGQQTYVFVLRRDKENNLYLHNHLGDIVGFIAKQEEVGIGRTSGILSVNRIGGGAFRHNIPRIGIITEDIGAVFAAKLAKDLFEKYKFSV
jgi:hypothetical protein